LIDFYDIPPLKDTVSALQRSGETFYGCYVDGELGGVISIKVEEGLIDIHRLMVHPKHFRKGIARRLLEFIESNGEGNEKLIVSTGSKNAPTIYFYEKSGFVKTGEVEVMEGLLITSFEKKMTNRYVAIPNYWRLVSMDWIIGGVEMILLKSKAKAFLILAIIFAVICGFVFYFNYGKPWNVISYKNKFGTYLEEKYNNDFVIEKISFDILHGGTYHAYAHAKDNPSVTFYVGQNPSTKETEDSYHYGNWEKQANEQLGPIVEKLFPDNFNYAVQIFEMENNNDAEGPETPSFIQYSTVEVGISMAEFEVTNENRDNEIERLFLLLSALKEEGVNFHHFGVSYKNKTIQLQPATINSINSAEDLEKWLVDYR